MKQIQKGFTLIELMIVVAIIGILAAVAIPAYQDYVVKAKLSKVQSTMDPIKTALVGYYQENGSFPLAPAKISVTNGAAGNAGTADVGPDVWTSIGLATFPTLPAEVAQLDYITDANGGSFTMTLTLANIKAVTINGAHISITPTPGTTVDAAPSATNMTTYPIGTAVAWHYACGAGTATSLDVILTKYFSNPQSGICTGTAGL